MAYLLAFGLGTVISMATFSWLMGVVTSRFAVGNVNVYRGMLSFTAVMAMAIGVFWLAA